MENEPAPTPMSKGERESLLKMLRSRERVANALASQRSAELLADFEAQLDRRYSYDEDSVWAQATAAANAAVAEAQRQVEARCRELGIPKEFAPSLSAVWYGRGRNASTAERAELRRVAKRRIEQIETAARTQIARASAEAQEKILLHGLTSEAAASFIQAMPSVETLMPALPLDEVQASLSAPKRLGAPAALFSTPPDEENPPG